MKKVLVVYSSLNQADGNSTKIAQTYLSALKASQSVTVTERDLVEMSLPHLSAKEMQAWSVAASQRNADQQALAAMSDTLVAEVQAADEIILAVPMYNFGIPSLLKAWLDRIARAGVTFRYTENGPVGLLEEKTVTVLAARGGMYAGTDKDRQSAYLQHFFSFIGIDDVRMVYAEGLAMGDTAARQGFDHANAKIIELTA
ncbi:FMN-dependent NADH-azoreductase [Alteromonas halophila]|uniref:FMN dependent NADH:quinone oxidoreductase n=1 Tax=Alteromonas halophila TaxID=516698 RepID=A0A918JRC0_9ALTE|nr:NAD(P)H-dependent oxidoreductase [Alteromonas halophila]GGW95637.1 FMN-dependent NADH-azoreductase [Alteromonas halophila]